VSNTYQPMTREQIIAMDGVDPEPIATDAQIVSKDEPWVKNHLKSLATGAISIPTDLIALPGMVMSGANALYRSQANDTKFLDEFQKDLMVDGATEKIQEHVSGIQQAWQQQNPGVTEEELKYATDEYMKSKQFEDFQRSQMSGTAWLQSKARDTIRRALGDERPESERSWTEGVAEVIGGAVVPGPTGWAGKVGSVAARQGGLTAAVAGSTLGRGTLKTAEVLTPLTMPYTPANVALNAGVGIAINQGTSAALGKPTAFTPTPEDNAGVGTLGVIAGGIVAGAAFVAAVKGRTGAALQAGKQGGQSATDAALQSNRAADLTLANPPQQGAAAITGGDPNTILPRSDVESLSPTTQVRRLARQNVFDQGSMIDQSIQDIHGGGAGRRSEQLRNDMSNAVTNEQSEHLANETLYGLSAIFRNLPEQEQRAAVGGWLNYSMDAQARHIISSLQDDVNDLTRRIEGPNATARDVEALTPKLQEAQSKLTRMLRDDEDVRVGAPDVPMKQKAAVARQWESDPKFAALRAEIKRVNKSNLDEAVASGSLSNKDASEFFARNPYFTPLVDDPFHGKTGISRIWAQAVANFRGKPHKQTFNALHTDPIHKLKDDLFDSTLSGGERRVISPMHPLSALHRYTQRLYKNKAQQLGRSQLMKMLTEADASGAPSALVRDKKIQIYENPNKQGQARIAWIEPHELHHKWVQEALTKPGVVPVMNGGRMRLWQMADSEWASVLRHDPIGAGAAWSMSQAAMNFFKFWTTGRGNLAFAFKGPLYDTPIMILTTPKDRVFGPLSYRIQKMFPNAGTHVTRYMPDVTAYGALPHHAIMTFIETQAWRMSRYLATQLSSEHSAFRAIEQVIGKQAYTKMIERALKVAAWSEQTPTAILRRNAGTRTAHSIDNIDTVRDALAMAKEQVPAPLRVAWQFYTDVIDMLYGSNKRQYFTQNYALAHQKYGGRVPDHVTNRLAAEARNAAGDMTKTPGGASWQKAEQVFPYLTQSKLGAYHLYRHMAGAETFHYMLPKLMLSMSAVTAGIYYMTYWDDEARDYYWNRMPVHERWRAVPIPHPKVLLAHYNGEKIPFNRDLIWNLTLPPDTVPLVAGAVSIAQQLGWIPGDATPRPIAKDLPNFIVDSLTPAMPPLFQAIAAQSGMKLDPQSSETRGGNWIREFGSNFKAGPQAESMSNLGQVTNSQALFLNAVFGAMGSHIALGTDIALHAAKYYGTEFGPAGQMQKRESLAFGTGLRMATDSVLSGVVSKIPDIPFMWRAAEKQSVSTPAWQYVKENDQHLRDIKGMHTDESSKTQAIRREAAIRGGGMPPEMLTDVALIKIASDINAYQAPKGDLGILRKQYVDLLSQSRAISAQYNMPTDQKRERLNGIIRQQQDNMVQQQMAIKYAEQKIAELYGQALAPRLNGRAITLGTLNQMMRESLGEPVAASR